MVAFLDYTDLTVASIDVLDPYFIIPSGYVEPIPYPLEIDTDQYMTPLLFDVKRAEQALYNSIEVLLRANIPGASAYNPRGNVSKLIGRSEFTSRLALTSRQLLTEIEFAKECFTIYEYPTAVWYPLACAECTDFIYECPIAEPYN